MAEINLGAGSISPEEFRQLREFYLPHEEPGKPSEYLGRSVKIWSSRGSKICKFTKQILKSARTYGAGRKNAPQGDKFRVAGKAEGGMAYTLPVFSAFDIYIKGQEIRAVTAKIKALKAKRKEVVAGSKDELKLDGELRELARQRKQALIDLGTNAAFMGLGIGGLITDSVVLRGVRAAGYTGKVLGGVATLLGVPGQIQGIYRLVKRGPELSLTERKIQGLADLALMQLRGNALKASKVLLDSHRLRVVQLKSDHRYDIFSKTLGALQTTMALTSQAVVIAGLIMGTAVVSASPLNLPALVLLGLGLACIAIRALYVNRHTWPLNLRELLMRARTESLKLRKRHLEFKLRRLHQGKLIVAGKPLMAPLNAETAKGAFRRAEVDYKIQKLRKEQRDLQCARIQAVYGKTFGGAGDLDNARQLVKAAMDLRREPAGRTFLRQFFIMFGDELPSHALEVPEVKTPEQLLKFLRSFRGEESNSDSQELIREVRRLSDAEALLKLAQAPQEAWTTLVDQFERSAQTDSERIFLRGFGQIFARA